MEFSRPYLRWLDERIAELDRQARTKNEQGDEFEAILDRIRSNVTGICRTMFALALRRRSPGSAWDEEVREMMAGAATPEDGLEAVYRLVLGRVSHAWAAGLEEARRTGELAEEVKSLAKLEALEAALSRLEALRRNAA